MSCILYSLSSQFRRWQHTSCSQTCLLSTVEMVTVVWTKHPITLWNRFHNNIARVKQSKWMFIVPKSYVLTLRAFAKLFSLPAIDNSRLQLCSSFQNDCSIEIDYTDIFPGPYSIRLSLHRIKWNCFHLDFFEYI